MYYAASPDRQETKLFFYEFAKKKARIIATIQHFVLWGFTVSPDERSLRYTQVGSQFQVDLMLVENFR